MTSDGSENATGFFQNYSDYGKAVRAWLVAYGIGGPVLFVSNEKVSERVAKSGFAKEILAMFLLGVGLQILSAMINKWAAWHIYRGAVDAPHQDTLFYRFWYVVNEQSWIDWWADVIALGALVYATWLVLAVFLGVASGA